MKKISQILLALALVALIVLPAQAKVIAKKATAKINTAIGFNSAVATPYFMVSPTSSLPATTTEWIGDLDPRVDSAYNLGSPTKRWKNIYANSLVSNGLSVANTSTIDLYLSTTGTDSGLCTSVATPCRTPEYTFNAIPTLSGGVAQVHVASGTYQFAGVYDFNFHSSAIGNADWISVVKIIGNTSTPSSVIFKAKNTATGIFNIRGPQALIELNGLTLKDSANVISVDNGNFNAKNLVFDNYDSVAISCIRGASCYLPSSDNALGVTMVASSTSLLTIGASAVINSYFSVSAPLTVSNFSGNGVGIQVFTNSNFNILNSTTTLTANASLGASSAIRSRLVSTMTLSSAHLVIANTFQPPTAGSEAQGAIAITNGRIQTQFATTFNISNSYSGLNLGVNGVWNKTTGANSVFTITSTTYPLIVQNSAVIEDNDMYSALIASTTFVNSIVSNPIYGYDLRYIKNPTRRVVTSSVALGCDDTYVSVSSTAALSLLLPNPTTCGVTSTTIKNYTIKDHIGNVAANNVSISATGGILTDGSVTTTMNQNYQSLIFTATTDGYEIN